MTKAREWLADQVLDLAVWIGGPKYRARLLDIAFDAAQWRNLPKAEPVGIGDRWKTEETQ